MIGEEVVKTKSKLTLIAVAVALISTILVANVTGLLTLNVSVSIGTTTSPPVIPTQTTTTPNLKGITLSGAGATFPYPQIVEWINKFHEEVGVSVNYQPVGSGAGLSQFFQNVTDFACSDPPLKRSDWEKYQGKIMQAPLVIGAVVVVYNVPEIPANYNLKLSGEVLAKIYRGDIEFWNDEEIKKLNPEVADKLPNQRIIGVYRSDSSGTTELLTTFLFKAAPGIWTKDLVGKTVDWPIAKTGRGIGGQGNPGVAQAVMNTKYSIGYVEWSFAITNKLSMASIRNKEGNYVLPSETSLKEALKGVAMPKSPLEDFSKTLDEVIYAPGINAYPITSPSYIILWRTYQSKEKALAMSEFLKWVATKGAKSTVPGYIPPPEEVVNLLLKASELVSQN